jgi:hypothetical protein
VITRNGVWSLSDIHTRASPSQPSLGRYPLGSTIFDANPGISSLRQNVQCQRKQIREEEGERFVILLEECPAVL